MGKKIEVPGAPAPAAADDDVPAATGAAFDPDDAEGSDTLAGAGTGTAEDEGDRLAAERKGKSKASKTVVQLEAELAAARDQLAAKDEQIRVLENADGLPKVVYMPETPHGKLAKAASPFANIASLQLMAMIDTGKADEPFNNVLCSDGYYVTRGGAKRAIAERGA
jgi:hypothetical protein